MNIKVRTSNNTILVTCPYSRAFCDFAHMRKAVWSDEKKVWMFDARDEFAVRGTLVEIFGTDDYEACQKVDVRVKVALLNRDGSSLFFLGRELAWRKYRDWAVSLGEGVAVVAGGFPPSGGSRGTPMLSPRADTVLEVRDVPISLAERAKAQYPEAIEILGKYDLARLREERDLLLKRLDEIERIIERYSEHPEVEEDIIADLQDEPNETSASGGREAIEG